MHRIFCQKNCRRKAGARYPAAQYWCQNPDTEARSPWHAVPQFWRRELVARIWRQNSCIASCTRTMASQYCQRELILAPGGQKKPVRTWRHNLANWHHKAGAKNLAAQYWRQNPGTGCEGMTRRQTPENRKVAPPFWHHESGAKSRHQKPRAAKMPPESAENARQTSLKWLHNSGATKLAPESRTRNLTSDTSNHAQNLLPKKLSPQGWRQIPGGTVLVPEP